MQRLTPEQAIVLMGFTGIVTIDFAQFHADVERRLGHSVQTVEMGSHTMAAKIRELYRRDFMEMCFAERAA